MCTCQPESALDPSTLLIVRLLLALVNRNLVSPHVNLSKHLSFTFLQPGSFPRNDASCVSIWFLQPGGFPRNDASIKFFSHILAMRFSS